MPKSLLLKRKSGLYVRFFVPVDLQTRIGSTYLVRSLQGVRADGARLMAAALGYALNQVFERLRKDAMTEPKGLLHHAPSRADADHDMSRMRTPISFKASMSSLVIVRPAVLGSATPLGRL
jgi:hypothetical protein